MKNHHWDDSSDGGDASGETNESAKDYFDSVALLQDDEFEEPVDKRTNKRRLTELRRKTEERLDWKRLYGGLEFDEYNYDLDDLDDGLMDEH